MGNQFDDVDTRELEHFARKLDAAQSGSKRAAQDAETLGMSTGTQQNLGECSDYLQTLYRNVYNELDEREAAPDDLETPE